MISSWIFSHGRYFTGKAAGKNGAGAAV